MRQSESRPRRDVPLAGLRNSPPRVPTCCSPRRVPDTAIRGSRGCDRCWSTARARGSHVPAGQQRQIARSQHSPSRNALKLEIAARSRQRRRLPVRRGRLLDSRTRRRVDHSLHRSELMFCRAAALINIRAARMRARDACTRVRSASGRRAASAPTRGALAARGRCRRTRRHPCPPGSRAPRQCRATTCQARSRAPHMNRCARR